MCRVLGYLGLPISLEAILFETDSSLVRQVYGPRMMPKFLNLAGFGMAAWDARAEHPGEPFTYRVPDVPTFDANLRQLSHKLSPTSLIAHVRGVTWRADEIISPQNVHPFRFPGARVALAHNGHLREFRSMRFDLVSHVRPELLPHVAGTTDSEWIYALVLSQLADPYGTPETGELVEAVVSTLRLLRDLRACRGIDTSSPLNLCVATRDSLVATRFSFDYGWYPPDDLMLETDLPYVSLWYTLGARYDCRDDEWLMLGGEPPQSLLIASEPLTTDTSTWLAVPEYSLVAATHEPDGLNVEMLDLDA